MSLAVREKADVIATFRHISVHVMETLARWVPNTAEFEAKTLFGRHLWDFAQHADQFGRRTAELRAALHYSRPPVAGYTDLLNRVRSTTTTPERIAAMYSVLLPDLESRYRAYRDGSDALLDEPSLRIIDRILSDFARMRLDCDVVLQERKQFDTAHPDWVSGVRRAFAAVSEPFDFRPPQAAGQEIA